MNEIQELIDRLDSAIKNLEGLQRAYASNSDERLRLGGKVEGVKLARSYVAEMQRNEKGCGE